MGTSTLMHCAAAFNAMISLQMDSNRQYCHEKVTGEVCKPSNLYYNSDTHTATTWTHLRH